MPAHKRLRRRGVRAGLLVAGILVVAASIAYAAIPHSSTGVRDVAPTLVLSRAFATGTSRAARARRRARPPRGWVSVTALASSSAASQSAEATGARTGAQRR